MTDESKESGEHPPPTWFVSARRAAEALLRDEHVASAVDATKSAVAQGGRAVATGLDKARGRFTQEEAWSQVETTLTDLVDVVRVQHAKILDLMKRVDALEARKGQPSQ